MSFENSEPKTGAIALFGIVTMVVVIAVVLFVEAFYDHAREQQVFVKTLQPVSEDLRQLRVREDAQLSAYGASDRIPIDRAMDQVVRDYAK